MSSFQLRNNISFLLYLFLALSLSATTSIAFTPNASTATNKRTTKVTTTKVTSTTSTTLAVSSRRAILQSLILPTFTSCILLNTNTPPSISNANAAPPFAIIAEELGYFPITNREGLTLYIPARIKRVSTDQGISLAKHLSSIGAIMYGTYWCGHTNHQKELFGREAFENVSYVECSTKGVYYDSARLEKVAKNIDGYPTWYIPNSSGKKGQGQWISGEMPLERFVALSNYKGDFDVTLEGPNGSAAGSC